MPEASHPSAVGQGVIQVRSLDLSATICKRTIRIKSHLELWVAQ